MHDNPTLLSYVPHGSDPNAFYPINESSKDFVEFDQFKSEFLSKHGNPEFVILFNSRNIRRKSPGDIVLSYKRFCDGLTKDQAKKCLLVMKTQVIDDNGTDLLAVKKAICPKYRIVFIPDLLNTQQMNWLYNLSDATIFLSSAEGFGLAANECMLAANGILIAPVTGGLQDQMRFEDENGQWINVNCDFPTNHRGRYKKTGEWAIPLFPNARILNGSPATPFIFDDYTDSEDAAKAIRTVYDMPKDERKRRASLGRSWAMSSESGMSSEEMCNRFASSMNKLFETWMPPTNKWELIKVDERPLMDDMGITWWEFNQ